MASSGSPFIESSRLPWRTVSVRSATVARTVLWIACATGISAGGRKSNHAATSERVCWALRMKAQRMVRPADSRRW